MKPPKGEVGKCRSVAHDGTGHATESDAGIIDTGLDINITNGNGMTATAGQEQNHRDKNRARCLGSITFGQ